MTNQAEMFFYMDDKTPVAWNLLRASQRVGLYLGDDHDSTILNLYFAEPEHLDALIKNATEAHAALVQHLLSNG